MAKKTLVILIDYVDLHSMDDLLIKGSDRIAMTADAMLAFKNSGLSYSTFDDAYPQKEFRNNNAKLIESTEDLFAKLDKKYEPLLNFPRAFTANILYFLSFFANVNYILGVAKKLKSEYEKIYLIGTPIYDGRLNIEMDFSMPGIAFHKFNIGLLNKVNILRECLSPECFWRKYNRSLSFNLGGVFCGMPNVFRQLKKKTASFFAKKQILDQKGIIYVIQDGYEVKLLREHMKGLTYIKPLSNLERIISKISKADLHLEDDSVVLVNDFIKKWFCGFEERMMQLFTVYNDNILAYIKGFLEHAENSIERDNPRALYYSIGANRIHEEVYAYCANKKNIPVFYFQHGGTTILYKHPYQKYVERNLHIAKIHIIHSCIEKDLLVKRGASDVHALGSARLQDIRNLHNTSKAGKKKEILYCSSVFNAYNYRDLTTNVTDKDFFGINQEILSAVDSVGLEMDIKVHPSDENYNYAYFKHLVDCRKYSFKILKGFPVERIINNYGLLILDCIGTMLVPISFVLNIPVIIYLKDESILEDKTLPDLKKRFYVAGSDEELQAYIKSYKSGDLKSRFSMEAINSHGYITNTKAVTEVISDFVKNRLSAGGKL